MVLSNLLERETVIKSLKVNNSFEEETFVYIMTVFATFDRTELLSRFSRTKEKASSIFSKCIMPEAKIEKRLSHSIKF